MAGPQAGQWARRVGMLAVGLPLTYASAGVVPVSWDCGPGYHKPRFGRCVPDAGVPLYRSSRYSAGRAHGRLPAPLRSMAPWGPNLRS